MTSPDSARHHSIVRSVIAITLVALMCAVLVFWINSSEPEAKREAATKRTAMLVEVMEMQSGTHTPVVAALGRVRPARDVDLMPQVNGHIIEMAEAFMPGGFVEKGALLAKIDDADYRNALRQAESELASAESNLSLELGRQDSASKEYELLQPELSNANRALVLREPQLNQARSQMLAAEASVNQAKLNLQRTEIRAPFAAHILSQHGNIGSQVGPATVLARLVGVDEYWVEVAVPVSSLKDISLPSQGSTGAAARIRDRNAWPVGVSRSGEVIQLIAALDDNTRLARLLISVSDPLNRNDGSDQSAPPLLLESIVQVEITGRPLDNVFRIPRDFLRQDDTLWLNRDNKLAITKATLVTKDNKYVYLSGGLKDGDQLITSNLATIAPGTPLRVAGASDE